MVSNLANTFINSLKIVSVYTVHCPLDSIEKKRTVQTRGSNPGKVPLKKRRF